MKASLVREAAVELSTERCVGVSHMENERRVFQAVQVIGARNAN